MSKELEDYLNQVRRNKEQGKGYCNNCALQKDHGPALIECVDDRPEVVVVSESPMGNLKEIEDISSWTRSLLTECYDKRCAKLSSARNMGEFIGGLTAGRIYSPHDETRTHGLYWTHTVKCFLQNKENKDKSIREIKEDRKADFEGAIKGCSNYLKEEITRIRPKLILAVGTSVAGKKLRELGFEENLCEVYHPGARKTKEKKRDRLNALCEKAKELNLTVTLPGRMNL